MTKLCPRGKAAAKRKFKVYPSAYANAYASKICAGKIKDPSGVKRKDFKGRKPAADGGLIVDVEALRSFLDPLIAIIRSFRSPLDFCGLDKHCMDKLKKVPDTSNPCTDRGGNINGSV